MVWISCIATSTSREVTVLPRKMAATQRYLPTVEDDEEKTERKDCEFEFERLKLGKKLYELGTHVLDQWLPLDFSNRNLVEPIRQCSKLGKPLLLELLVERNHK